MDSEAILSPVPVTDRILLTAEGGQFDISRLREDLAVYSNGDVLTSIEATADPELVAAIGEWLEKIGDTHQLRPAVVMPRRRIAQLYERGRRKDDEGRADSLSGRSGRGTGGRSNSRDAATGMALDLLARTKGQRVSDIHIIEPHDHKGLGSIAFEIAGDSIEQIPAPSAEVARDYIEALWALAASDNYGHVSSVVNKAERYPRFTYHGDKLPEHLSSIRGILLSGFGRARKAVIRLVESSNGDDLPTMAEGSYSEDEQREALLLARRPTGLVAIAGDVGHGKTTLAYSLLQENYRYRRANGWRPTVYTIEEPPERLISHWAYQIEVRSAGDWLDAASALLRAAPKMLLFGELKNEPETQACFRLLLSSVSTITTIHGNSAFSVHTKFLNMGLPPFMMADPSLFSGYIGQRLVRKLCPHCSRHYTVEDQHDLVPTLARLGLLGRAKRRGSTMRSCPEECNDGVIGRVPLVEIVRVDGKMLTLLNRSVVEAEDHWLRHGGVSMGMKALRLVERGEVDPVDAMDVADLSEVAERMQARPGTARRRFLIRSSELASRPAPFKAFNGLSAVAR